MSPQTKENGCKVIQLSEYSLDLIVCPNESGDEEKIKFKGVYNGTQIICYWNDEAGGYVIFFPQLANTVIDEINGHLSSGMFFVSEKTETARYIFNKCAQVGKNFFPRERGIKHVICIYKKSFNICLFTKLAFGELGDIRMALKDVLKLQFK